MRDGSRFLFQPSMTVIHDFEGSLMVCDIRCHIGWSTIRIRQINPHLRFSGLLRLGLASIPLFYSGRVLESWGTCFQVGHQYGLRVIDYSFALGLSLWIHFLKIKGHFWRSATSEWSKRNIADHDGQVAHYLAG